MSQRVARPTAPERGTVTPGALSYHGEINGLPVIVWAITDYALARSTTYQQQHRPVREQRMNHTGPTTLRGQR